MTNIPDCMKFYERSMLRKVTAKSLILILLLLTTVNLFLMIVAMLELPCGTLLLIRNSQNVSITKQIETKVGYRAQYDVLSNDVSNNMPIKSRTRQDRCDNCFQHNFKSLIDNTEACKQTQGDSQIEILFLITTSPANFVQRQALRDTWLSQSRNNTANIRHLFLFGNVSNSKLQDKIIAESNTFHDVYQEDFIDSYDNLTYKTIMGYKWAAVKCSVAKFVMKTDDDMYVNVPEVLKLARTNALLLQTHIMGNCSYRAKPNRDTESKWFASVDSYPGKYYPGGYCSGTGYLTSMNVVTKVYEVSPNVPFFHLEDVYTSFCVRRLGYKLRTVPGFHTKKCELGLCLYKTAQLVTSHYMDAELLKSIWNAKCNI